MRSVQREDLGGTTIVFWGIGFKLENMRHGSRFKTQKVKDEGVWHKKCFRVEGVGLRVEG